MKRKFDRLRETLDEFLQQDDYPMLVVGSRSDELAYILNFLRALEQTLPSHRVIVFHQTFDSPTQWLDAVVAGLRPQLEALASGRAEQGEPRPPPLPFDVEDRRCGAPQRLEALLRYLLELLPNPQDYSARQARRRSNCPAQARRGSAKLHALSRAVPKLRPP